MKDDYLWDGTGDPDTTVARLERELTGLRFARRPLKLHKSGRASRSRWMAIAASIIVLSITALLIISMYRSQEGQFLPELANGDEAPVKTDQETSSIGQGSTSKHGSSIQPRKQVQSVATSRPRREISSPIVVIDVARHIESTQLLLREVKNIEEGIDLIDIDREKLRAQKLLEHNIRLRRRAADELNISIEDTLSLVEPFLQQIANLDNRTKPEELTQLKQRIIENELIARLQVYSAPGGAY
jgi:hypothetical protein